jgi:hypothetical protein
MLLYAVRFALLLSLSSASGLKAASACIATISGNSKNLTSPEASWQLYTAADSHMACPHYLQQIKAGTAALTLRMLDFMSDGGSLEILMQVCRMDSGTILACRYKHMPW